MEGAYESYKLTPLEFIDVNNEVPEYKSKNSYPSNKPNETEKRQPEVDENGFIKIQAGKRKNSTSPPKDVKKKRQVSPVKMVNFKTLSQPESL